MKRAKKRRRKLMTAAQRAASKLGRLSYEKRLQTEGYDAIRARCIENTKRFRFKKRGKKPPVEAPALSTTIGAPPIAAKPAFVPPEVKAVPTTVQPRTVSMALPQPVVEKPSEVPAPAPTYTDLFIENMRERFEAGKKLDEAEMQRRAVEEYFAKH